MAYNSLLDQLQKQDPGLKKSYESFYFIGKLETIISELKDALEYPEQEGSLLKRVLHPPRIIRGLSDYKIEEKYVPTTKYLLRDAIRLGLNVYNQDESVLDNLEKLTYDLDLFGHEDALKTVVTQKADVITWIASSPKRNDITARRLLDKTEGEPVLFIALAHGGVMAGMDTFLRYQDYADSENSEFYVTRLSAKKMYDVSPRLSLSELVHLNNSLLYKRLVIFDEDSSTGRTLELADKYFKENMDKTLSKDRIIITNMDATQNVLGIGQDKINEALARLHTTKEKEDYLLSIFAPDETF